MALYSLNSEIGAVLAFLFPNWQTFNQTDRVQGIARYMNADGASVDWMALLAIFLGMATVILLLKFASNRAEKKRIEAMKKRMAANKERERANTAKASTTRSRRPNRATRLR